MALKISKKQLQHLIKEETDSYLLMLEGAAPSMAKVLGGKGVLRTGMRGPAVAQMQGQLGIPDPDGIFGGGTTNAVRAFQKKAGLSPDGVFGQSSAQKLMATADYDYQMIGKKPSRQYHEAGRKDLEALASHLGTFSYVTDDDMKEIYDIIQSYNKTRATMKSLIVGYQQLTGNRLIDDLKDVSGVGKWKTRALGLWGCWYLGCW